MKLYHYLFPVLLLLTVNAAANTLDFAKAAETAQKAAASNKVYVQTGPACPESCRKYTDTFYEESEKDLKWLYIHRHKGFEWNHTSTIIIFWVVVVIVVAGVTLSILEFRKDLKNPAPTVLKFSLKEGIEVSSSVIGVILLTFSLVFFYLYLKEVYPIVEVSNPTVQPANQK